MAQLIRKVEYFCVNVADRPGEAYRLLARCQRRNINLLAVNVFSCAPGESQLDFFPEKPAELIEAAKEMNTDLIGPKVAFLVQGEDRVGALADIYRMFHDANVNIHAANGACDGEGHYSYILWVRGPDIEAAEKALGIKDNTKVEK